MKTYKIKTDSKEIYYVESDCDESDFKELLKMVEFIKDTDGWQIETSKIESFIDISRESEDV